MTELKKNVTVFNADVHENSSYRYTTKAALSSVLANRRMTEATLHLLDDAVRTAVDIGSGDGTYTHELKQHKPQMELAGFDPADKAVKAAQEKYPHIHFYIANILDRQSLPLKKFDAGIIRGVLHHLSDPRLAIENAGILAKKIIIIEPNGNNPVLKVIEKVSPYHRQHEEQSFSSRQLRKWCEESGFEVKHLNYIGFIPMFFPAFLARIIYFFQPFLERFRLLKKYLGAQIVILCEKKNEH